MKCNVNFSDERLISEAVKRDEGFTLESGVLCTYTGEFTGRSPKGKVIVLDRVTRDYVDWRNNDPILPDSFNNLYLKFADYLEKNETF